MHTRSSDQDTDVMTKELPQDVFKEHRRFILGLSSVLINGDDDAI